MPIAKHLRASSETMVSVETTAASIVMASYVGASNVDHALALGFF